MGTASASPPRLSPGNAAKVDFLALLDAQPPESTNRRDEVPVTSEADEVVLVDDAGRPVGRHDRRAVHGRRTPRHLAFSCWIVDPDGLVLMTRRALTKRSWPGVWTNSCCGHPRPDEDPEVALRRRVGEELGIVLDDVACVLPDFSYTAVVSSVIVE